MHFETEKPGVYTVFKIFSTWILEQIYKMQRLEVSGAVRPLECSMV